MANGYFSGLVEGFSGARDKAYLQNTQQEMARRAGESRIYEYLLQSRDPEIQSMALTALFESARPVGKAKGLRGFMGDVEASSFYPQIRALMDQQVPNPEAERALRGIAPPPRPGSAALPTQSMVDPEVVEARRGRSDIPEVDVMAPPTMQAAPSAVEQAPMLPPGRPDLAGATMAGMTTPPESRFKRRGTGVPTAEEIAEATAVAQMRGRIKTITEAFRTAPTEGERRLISAMGGQPVPLRPPTNVPGVFAVLPDGREIPVARDPDSGQLLDDRGAPLPEGVTYKRTAGASRSLASYLEDTPEGRAWLLQQGADPAQIAAGSPTGYWEYTQDTAGNFLVNASEFSPAPTFGGTTTIFDPTSPTGRRIVPLTPRGDEAFGAGGPPGPPPAGELAPEQASARALLAEIDKWADAFVTSSAPVASMRRKPTPAQFDQATRDLARRAGLPYTRYFEVQRAAQRTGTSTVPSTSTGSAADRVRQRLLEQQGTAPPARPPARSQGAGPR